jgi:hypothetical protein
VLKNDEGTRTDTKLEAEIWPLLSQNGHFFPRFGHGVLKLNFQENKKMQITKNQCIVFLF